MNAEYLRRMFSQCASVRDPIPAMVEKLHQVLMTQDAYQRAVPLVMAALLFKETYALGSDVEEAETSAVDRQAERDDVVRLAEEICRKLANRTRESYVRKGKRTQEEFDKYVDVVKGILMHEFGGSEADGVSYYSRLAEMMPGLTKAVYAKKHRAVLEYLAKRAKKDMTDELRRHSSAT